MQSSFAVFVRAAVMLGVLVVLPAYALLGTTLPDKMLPLLERLALQHQPPLAEQEPASPLAEPNGQGPDFPVAAAWRSDAPSRLPPSPNRPSENRLVSWEEASPRPSQNPSLRQPPEVVTTIRVREDGRRVLSNDRFAELERALREVGATNFTVSVEYLRPAPRYWCSCQVVDRRDRFEASAADGPGAMEAVLRQIRAWRSAGSLPRR